MAFFEWNDELSVGITEIDEQHKKLVEMINDFYEGIEKKSSNDNMVTLIGAMADYTVYHFSVEEKYFDAFNYAKTEEHKLKHQEFVDKILDVQKRLDSGKLVISFEITIFLKNWLKEHIMGEDPEYVSLFLENGVK